MFLRNMFSTLIGLLCYNCRQYDFQTMLVASNFTFLLSLNRTCCTRSVHSKRELRHLPTILKNPFRIYIFISLLSNSRGTTSLTTDIIGSLSVRELVYTLLGTPKLLKNTEVNCNQRHLPPRLHLKICNCSNHFINMIGDYDDFHFKTYRLEEILARSPCSR